MSPTQVIEKFPNQVEFMKCYEAAGPSPTLVCGSAGLRGVAQPRVHVWVVLLVQGLGP